MAKLLLIDDDRAILETMKIVLGVDDHDIVSASDGQQGIDAFKSALAENKPFDAVVSDITMPGIDGRTVAIAIKASSPTTPVILLSGLGDAENKSRFVDHVFKKPGGLDALRALLKQLSAPN